MISKTASFVIILTVFLWNVEGLQGTGGAHTQVDAGRQNGQDELPFNLIHNQSFDSIDDLLSNATSNSIVNIRSDVVLSSCVLLEGLENITITGHESPTVNCNGTGALKFVSCKNVTVAGVNWEKCGSSTEEAYPGIKFYNSSNVVIQDCFFHNLTGQAVLMSIVSGNVHITNCNFTHINKYEGHGVALHYSIKDDCHLLIEKCIFSNNGPAKSVIYIGSATKQSHEHLRIEYSRFNDNDGVPIYISQHSLHFKGDVIFENNVATSGAGILSSKSIVVFDDKSNVSFYNNSVYTNGGAIFLNDSKLHFGEYTVVKFKNNSAEVDGGALFTINKSNLSSAGKSVLIFQGNKASVSGGALYCEKCSASVGENSTMTFSDNSAIRGGAVYSSTYSNISFVGKSNVTFNNNRAEYGGALYSISYSKILFSNSSTVLFTGNDANENGGAVNSFENSSVVFNGNSVVTFADNRAKHGGAMFSLTYSIISFDGNTTVTFAGNGAMYEGTVYSSTYSNISFDGKSNVTFNKNRAEYGGALYSISYSQISFNNSSIVLFTGNDANENGGAVNSFENSSVVFNGNSVVTFADNRAKYGGAMFSLSYSTISFNGNTTATFDGNSATYEGAVHSSGYSNVSFVGKSNVTFKNNYVSETGGAIGSLYNSIVSMDENSVVQFIHNSAKYGGAFYTKNYCYISFHGNSKVTFKYNFAMENGGAVNFHENCKITFDNTSAVTFKNNTAKNGGAVYILDQSFISVDGNSTVRFAYNRATFGGAMFSLNYCDVSFEGKSTGIFNDNKAAEGGGVYCEIYSNLLFNGNTIVTFKGNKATANGGCIYCYESCSVIFQGNSMIAFMRNNAENGAVLFSSTYSDVAFNGNVTVTFESNKASKNGGSINLDDNSNAIFDGNSTVAFGQNTATMGGAMYCNRHSYVVVEGNTKVDFIANKAVHGGALNIQQSIIEFTSNSSTRFIYNVANKSGGAVYFSTNFTASFDNEIVVIFHQNSAILHGGAIYGELIENNQSKISSKFADIKFDNNTALVGDDVYMHIQPSCNEACLNNSIVGLNVTHNYPPHHLALYNPTTCADTINSSRKCQNYFVSNIMLGQNIKINACVLSFHDQPAGGVDFVVSGGSEQYFLEATRFVPIACQLFEGISIIGEKISNKKNFSMTITSYTNSESEISIKLVAELSPCHPGFFYDNATQKCVCYNDRDIVSCSGSTSIVKRGYWFGVIDSRPTVTVCPNNYCNFTCCEMTNGFHQLSPVRTNQCNSHRSGIACGNCNEGYTLPFDSPECVDIDKCTPEQASLVIILSMIYWIALVVVVFIVTYYQTGIGYCYAVTYYYSMLDILLGQHLYTSRGLFTTISIISSIAKATPQYLGQLCLVEDMSGIDQQFIHYVHPLAVTIIVAIICLLARMSYRFSAYVSRGIIRVICFLLLLSYTSVATTSLLLLRSLTFVNVDKVYTYLSPDMEYFQGRHLEYVAIAALCTIAIVIGLPLLLVLEPFLNHKINFTSVKPLLDQFQGCYKDKYRCFAAYYMICRVVLILIILANSSNDNAKQVLLHTACTLLALTQLIVKPYKSEILNIFDGVVLQIMIFASVVSLFDSFGSDVLLVVTIILVVLPLLSFVVMELVVYKDKIKNVIMNYCCHKPTRNTNSEINNIPTIDVITIDDNMRRNVTICEM